jgi:hypothetical protein
MAQTFGPAVSGASRRQAMRLHVTGLLLGSGTMAAAVTLVGTSLPLIDHRAIRVVAAVLGVLAAGWAAKMVFRVGLRYPRATWQVPEEWRHKLPIGTAAAAYGFLLGLGALTDVVLPAFWLLVGLTIVAGKVSVALAAWTVYGFMRAWMTGRMVQAVVERPGLVGWLAGPRGYEAVHTLCAAVTVMIAARLISGALL